MPVLDHTRRARGRFTDPEIKKIVASSRQAIADWVCFTAAERGITYNQTPADQFAYDASRLSDAGTELDEVEKLLLAIRRAGFISSTQRLLLHGAYVSNGRRTL